MTETTNMRGLALLAVVLVGGCTTAVGPSEAELKARRASWRPPAPRVTTGWLSRYSKMVTSGSRGAVLTAD
jgi:dihydroxyacid dehydratase/phosphogluconate dehydratase